MSGSCREALSDVQKWSKNPPGCPGVVGRPLQISGSGRESLPDIREWSGGPPRCPVVFGRTNISRFSCVQIASLNLCNSRFCLLPLSENVLQWTPVPSKSRTSLTCFTDESLARDDSAISVSIYTCEAVSHFVSKESRDLYGSFSTSGLRFQSIPFPLSMVKRFVYGAIVTEYIIVIVRLVCDMVQTQHSPSGASRPRDSCCV